MARVIAEAAVRLTVDRKGLGESIRREFREAVKEASGGGSMFDSIDRDSDESARRTEKRWVSVLGGLKSSLTGLLSGFAVTGKFLLLGTAAAGALAGIVSLTTGVISLGSALVTASGVVGLLPAALATLAAVKGTLALGLSGISDGFKAVTGDAATFNEAIKGLAPNAQSFLRAIREQAGAFKDLKLDVQNRLFLGLADAIKPLANNYLPLANRLFVTIAGSINNAARQTVDFANSSQTVGKVGTLVDNVRRSVQSLSEAFAPAVAALLDLTTVGSNFLPGISDAISNASKRFAEFIREAAQSGKLQEFFQRAIDTLKQLGRIVSNVFDTLKNVMGAARSQGAGLLNTIEAITGAFKAWTASTTGQEALKSFFASMQRVVHALGPAFRELVEIVGRDFVPILADIAETIGPVLKPLFETFGRLLVSLRPLIQALAGAFATALAALEPFFNALAKAIDEAMPTLGPIIQDIGKAFADLFKALVPLAPVFVQLLEVLLPIIPPFVRMIADIMPTLIDLLKALMPLIQELANAFIALLPFIANVVNFFGDVFIPIISVVSQSIAGLVILVTAVAKGIWAVVTTVFGAIADFFVNIWNGITGVFSAAWDAIQSFFSNGISGALASVGQFASNLWNAFKSAMGNAVSAVISGIGDIVSWFAGLPGKILGALGDLVGKLFQAGKDLIQGLWNGIKSMVQKIIDAVKNLVNDAITTAKKALGIQSPSTVFKEIGRNVGLGMIAGLDGIAPAVADAATAMADVSTDALGNPFATGANAVAGAATGTTTVVNQTNVMRPGADVKQFSDIVLRRGLGDFLSGASTLSVVRNGVQAGVNDQWVGV